MPLGSLFLRLIGCFLHVYFISISLLSGCWHEVEDEETSNKSVSSETQDRVFVADLKTRVHDTCAPLRDILHLAEYQGDMWETIQ